MDRDRLKEVHATEVSESKINEDFVEWLKTKAPTYLVLVLLGVAMWMFWVRWQQRQTQYNNQAWSALLECQLPSACEDVAIEYADVPGLPQQARRQAADSLLIAVQKGSPIGAQDSNPLTSNAPVTLTVQEREDYLTRADRLYKEVIESDDGSMVMTLHVVSAMQGRAVVAESRGDGAQAKQWYTSAADRAAGMYGELATRLRQRAESASNLDAVVTLPSSRDLPQPDTSPSVQPATIDGALREILQPALTGAG